MAYQGYKWQIQFSDGSTTEITRVEGIKLETDVIELKPNSATGAYIRKKLPGRMKSGTITVTRGMSPDTTFADWLDNIVKDGLSRQQLKSGTMKLVGPQSDTVVEFSFTNAWPATWTAGQLDPSNPDDQLEAIELAHDSLTRIK